MTIQQLNYVVTVAQTGSMTEAAHQLYVSQPNLTSAIHKLEAELGFPIFRRFNKGSIPTADGESFLAYARQILEQVNLVENKFLHVQRLRPKFSVSCQHYAFAVNAFVDLIRQFDAEQYDFTIRETQTYEVLEDVSRMKSEVGILYTNDQNEEFITKLIKDRGLVFEPLFVAKPHVFISATHPLCHKKVLTLDDLKDYPCLTFDQGDYNAFYFSEEILSTLDHNKNIHVHDRGTLFNLAVGLNGYTITSGVLGQDLNGKHMTTRPLDVDDYFNIGIIRQKDSILSIYGQAYVKALQKYISDYPKD